MIFGLSLFFFFKSDRTFKVVLFLFIFIISVFCFWDKISLCPGWPSVFLPWPPEWEERGCMPPHLPFVLLDDALLQRKCGLRESTQFQLLKINFCPQTLLGMFQSIEALRVYFIYFYFFFLNRTVEYRLFYRYHHYPLHIRFLSIVDIYLGLL